MNTQRKKYLIAGSSTLIGIFVIALFVILNDEPEVVIEEVIEESAYIVPAAFVKDLSPVTFTDVTEHTGISYQHYNGAFVLPEGTASRYMPETMGSGAVLFDYDNDNDLDIFIANSSDFNSKSSDEKQPTSHLYRNEGNFKFTDVTKKSGLEFTLYGMGAISADYDGDQYQDLLLTTWGGVQLLRNKGNGSFENVSNILVSDNGDEGKSGSTEWSTGAVFFDADGDLDLDIYVINYIDWSPGGDLFSTMDGKRKSYNTPNFYRGYSGRLYIQDKGKFFDKTKNSGLYNDEGKSLGVALWDFNDDGLLDIVVANDTQPNFLFFNRGEGRFEEVGLDAGIAYDENGRTRAGMGIDIADYANDGTSAIAIGNFSREPVSVFRQQGPAFFREFSQQTGVASPTYLALTFGLAFADMDLDGWQDLLLANGHTEPNVQDVEAQVPYRQPLLLLGNTRDSNFTNWSATAGEPFQKPIVGRGLAVGDLDGDGDLDLVVTENNGPLYVIRNDVELSSRQYLRVLLQGRSPNTDAIGAKIELESAGLKQRRMVRTGSSYLSQSELTQTFGIDKGKKVDKLTVTWPDGKRMEFQPEKLNGVLIINEESGGMQLSKR